MVHNVDSIYMHNSHWFWDGPWLYIFSSCLLPSCSWTLTTGELVELVLLLMRLRSFGTIYECISFYVVETEPFVLCVLCLGQRLDQRIRNVFAALLWVFVTLSFSAGHWRASKSWWKKSGLTSATRWRTGAARAWEAPTQMREVPFSCSGSTVFIRCNKYGFCSRTS